MSQIGFPRGLCSKGKSRRTAHRALRLLPSGSSSWTGFVDDVKRCFRGSAETAEASRGDYLANAFFA